MYHEDLVPDVSSEFGFVDRRDGLGDRRATHWTKLVVVKKGFSHVPSKTYIPIYCIRYDLDGKRFRTRGDTITVYQALTL